MPGFIYNCVVSVIWGSVNKTLTLEYTSRYTKSSVLITNTPLRLNVGSSDLVISFMYNVYGAPTLGKSIRLEWEKSD